MKVVDMHCDTIGEILKDHQNGGNMSILENSLHIDLQKMKKGDSITKIADDLVEDEIVISPIYKMVKESEDTERDIYQRVTCSHHLNP